jgi:2-dehydropantoate 2-reductase
MKVTVVGAGAIGGVLGAHLARYGHDVTFSDIVEDHVSQIRTSGIRIEGPEETFTVRAKACTPDELLQQGEPLETVLLCVKAQHTEAAVQQFLPLLRENSQVVSVQNGLCENIISRMIGKDRTIGCFVNFSADYIEPGRILYGGVSALYLGEIDGSVSGRILELQRVLSCWGPVQVTNNIWGYLWGKLSYAALLFATAFVDETMAGVVREQAYRPTLMALCSEVLEVAAKENVHPLGFDDWEPSLVYPKEMRDDRKLDAQLEKLATRMASNKKTKSGIWRDLVVRKRKTEVDFQLTPVVELGEQYGLSLPLTRKVIETIKGLEDGTISMKRENLDALKACYESMEATVFDEERGV